MISLKDSHVQGECKRGLLAVPLCFGAMDHVKMKRDSTQRNKADWQTLLTSSEESTGLRLD